LAKVSVVKGIKAPKSAHTSNSKKGMGDYYGSGVKNPTGKVRDNTLLKTRGSKNLGKPPKSLA
jgi:hypothetical protein